MFNEDFDDVETAWRWFALTSAFRQSPRPVLIDDKGCIFETNGDRFVAPGVTSDEVLRAISETNDGPTRSLKDIIASRFR